MKLEELTASMVSRAIDAYLELAYGAASKGRDRPDLALEPASGGEPVLGLFQSESVRGEDEAALRRFTMRLGNRNYPFMKLLMQEHIVAGEFYFAVDTHDQMEIKPGFPDYEAWMAVRRFNRDLKQQIEAAFDRNGLDTAACLRRAVQARQPAGQSAAGRGTVLIVDDEQDLADAVELLLRARGFATVKLSDGASVAATAARLLPTLVLLDYELPEMDGLQALAQLRSNPATRGIPVLLSSAAQVSIADIRRADGFLAKPFHEGLLYEMVDRVLRCKEGQP